MDEMKLLYFIIPLILILSITAIVEYNKLENVVCLNDGACFMSFKEMNKYILYKEMEKKIIKYPEYYNNSSLSSFISSIDISSISSSSSSSSYSPKSNSSSSSK